MITYFWKIKNHDFENHKNTVSPKITKCYAHENKSIHTGDKCFTSNVHDIYDINNINLCNVLLNHILPLERFWEIFVFIDESAMTVDCPKILEYWINDVYEDDLLQHIHSVYLRAICQKLKHWGDFGTK